MKSYELIRLRLNLKCMIYQWFYERRKRYLDDFLLGNKPKITAEELYEQFHIIRLNNEELD